MNSDIQTLQDISLENTKTYSHSDDSSLPLLSEVDDPILTLEEIPEVSLLPPLSESDPEYLTPDEIPTPSILPFSPKTAPKAPSQAVPPNSLPPADSDIAPALVTPTEEASAEDVAVKETPAKEASAEKAALEEAIAEETPEEDTLVEKIPTESVSVAPDSFLTLPPSVPAETSLSNYTLQGTPGERHRTVLLDSQMRLSSLDSELAELAKQTYPTENKSKLPLLFALTFICTGITLLILHSINFRPHGNTPGDEIEVMESPIASIEVEPEPIIDDIPPRTFLEAPAPVLQEQEVPDIGVFAPEEFEQLAQLISETSRTYEIAEQYYKAQDYENALAQYQKTEGNFQRLLAHYEKSLGAEHSETVIAYKNLAITYNNIGETYFNQNKYGPTLDNLKKALSIREKINALDHPDTGRIYANLAHLYDAQGKYQIALDWFQKDLAISEKIEDNFDTAIIYDNIGKVYFHMGNRTKAIESFRKALKIHEAIDMGSIETATTRNNIAEVYRTQGNYERALPEFLQAYRTYRNQLGENDPKTLLIHENLERAFNKTSNSNTNTEFSEWLEDSLL
ncbi:MAG: tetratricopeptide repeat protein [Azoarcus sp.]|jgi:tetratricopeptide (TPR) repeat protein|nr:tetratricopeptide repeat protein [Azoarcus sp.]